MRELKATFKIITPMFIGGANQSPSDGIRPPSVKGALRFWWRALNWAKHWQEAKNEEQALRSLHKEEARLFGASMGDNENKGGQGCFLFSVIQPDISDIIIERNYPVTDGDKYLGYGLSGNSIKEGMIFTLNIIYKNTASEEDITTIKEVLEVWSLFGGLGGRYRRSFGSITLISLNENKMIYSSSKYIQTIEKYFGLFQNTPKAPYTAFCKESKYEVINKNKGNVRNIIRNLGNDYNSFRGSLGGVERKSLGLPFSKKITDTIDNSTGKRRSSPLFFHLHKIDEGVALTKLFLPSRIYHHEYRELDNINAGEEFIKEVII